MTGAPWQDSGVLMVLVAAAAGTALLAAGLTRWLIRHAPRFGLEDIPNHRSSHQRTTPRGGGIAFVVASALGLAAVIGSGHVGLPPPAWLAAFAGGLMLAVVGLVDDLRPLGQRLRLACQCLAVALIVQAGLRDVAVATAAAPTLAWSPELLDPSMPWLWLLGIVAALAGVWWINLFNFMDGTDGLAAGQALFLLLAYLGLRALSLAADGGPGPAGIDPIDWLALLLAAALVGFLPFNWSPARIFMGDAGSLFLGVAIFLVAMHSVTSGRISPWFWPIAAGSFICDASATLVRRQLSGQNVFSAHRSHFYQRLSRRWADHRRVALVYSAINISWFLPLALLSQHLPRSGGALLLTAYVPALLILWFAGAGKPDAEATAATDPGTGGQVFSSPDQPGTSSTDKGRARTQRT